MSGATPGQAAQAAWEARHAGIAPGDLWEKIAQAAISADSDRDRYYEALQCIVDVVTDPDAVDKLARNALGLTRVGKPSQRRNPQPAPELADAMREAERLDDAVALVHEILAVFGLHVCDDPACESAAHIPTTVLNDWRQRAERLS